MTSLNINKLRADGMSCRPFTLLIFNADTETHNGLYYFHPASDVAGNDRNFKIVFITIVLSIPLGILLALARVSSLGSLRSAVGVYVWLLRGTPLMLQLLFVYYGLPFIPGIGIRMDDFQAAIFAFVLNYAAYFCEIFRAGIQAIPKGQYEAARTLGMNYVQTMRRIILPQVFRIILPPVSNETITLVKDTSLIYVLAMNDLLRTTRNLVQRDFSITPFLVAGVFIC